MEMDLTEEPPIRSNGALKAVWIKSSEELLFEGLESALRTGGTSVHCGPQAPQQQGAAPSVVVYSPKDDEELASGVQELRELNPQAVIVVFGASADLSLARAALQADADGFLHAGMPPQQIARALHKAHEGEDVTPRQLLGGLVKELVAKEREPDLSRFGSRKIEILEMVAEGLSNAQIARRLYLSLSRPSSSI